MKTKLHQFLLGFWLLAGFFGLAAAESSDNKVLRIAVYRNFPPYSYSDRGIDVELGQALAQKLAKKAEIVWFNPDEDMNDDLRNMVWKGHYLGTRPADLMMHVPVDPQLKQENPQVNIFAPYHIERLAVARNRELVGKLTQPLDWQKLTDQKVGVEIATLGDAIMLSMYQGRYRSQVIHFKNVAEAVAGLRDERVALVLAPKSELEASLSPTPVFSVDDTQPPTPRSTAWTLGLAVRQDAHELAEQLQSAMRQLRQDGTVAAIFKRNGITYSPIVEE